MQWELPMLSMGWWMFISSIVLLALLAVAVWAFVRWATPSHAHAAVSAPVASSRMDVMGQSDARGDMNAAPEPRSVHVTLLTAPQCGYSEEAKAALLRLAHDYPLDIDVVALRSPAGDRLALQGCILFPPGLFLDDEPFCYGRVSEPVLRQELARRSGMSASECGEATSLRLAIAHNRD